MFLGSLLAVSFPVPVGSVLVLPEVYRFINFLEDDFWYVFRIQFSLVRQWSHVWRQSMILLVLDTKHTFYELCLPSELGFGMCMDLADPVSSGGSIVGRSCSQLQLRSLL